jgi:site-specific DNA-methyltransferase (adenine-specific)
MCQPQSIATNEDCMDVMKRYPDKFFALAIVDPPYGIGDGTITAGNIRKSVKYKKSKWNNAIPPKKYFKELRRVSQNQIIW